MLGIRFSVPVVAAMTGRSVGDCLAWMDEAARAALVVEGAAPGERRFAHDLVRDAIVAGVDAGQRVTLHRRAAEAIECHVPHGAGMAFDLAHHWAEASVDGDRAVGGDVDGAGRPGGDAAARLRGGAPVVRAGARRLARGCWTTPTGAG